MDFLKLFLSILATADIFFLKSFFAKFCKKSFRTAVSIRNLILWDFIVSEFKCHITSVGNFLSVFNSRKRIREQFSHLFFAFYKELSSLVTHPVLVRNLPARLDAKKHIMCFHISFICIMHIVRTYKLYPQFLAHSDKLLVYKLLIVYAVILKFQKKVVFSKTIPVFFSYFLCILIKPSYNISRYLTGKTRRKTYKPLMILFKSLKINPWSVIISFCKSDRHYFHEVCITFVIFC